MLAHQLLGKKILVFDLETTGLDARARITQVSWYFTKSFNKTSLNHLEKKTRCYYRKPIGFNQSSFQKGAIEVTGITYEKCKKNGHKLSRIINDYGFGTALQECDYLVAHNISFDYRVLTYELEQLNFQKSLEKLQQMKQKNSLICTAQLASPILKLKNKVGARRIPKLIECYRHFFGEDFDGQHDALEDVKATTKVLYQLSLNHS